MQQILKKNIWQLAESNILAYSIKKFFASLTK